MACACGRFWIEPGRELLRFAFVNPDLLDRLRDYRTLVRWGDAGSIAEAVAATALRERQQRDAGRARARADWPRLQAAKRAKWWRRMREILLVRPCAYCGGVAKTLDHIVPRARGGKDEMRNLAPACKRCNSEKWRWTVDEWKAWRLRRGRPWPPVPAAA